MAKYSKKPNPSELGDGDSESRIFKNMPTEQQVRTKMGADGVEETHVSYVPLKSKLGVYGFGDNYDLIDWTDRTNRTNRTNRKQKCNKPPSNE